VSGAPMLPMSLAEAQSTAPAVIEKRVLEFLLEWTSPARKTLRCKFFVLIHVSGEGDRAPLTTAEVTWRDPDPKKKDDAAAAEAELRARCDEVSRLLVRAAISAHDHASNLRQQFAVAGYTNTREDTTPYGQVFFSLVSSDPMRPGLGETESPTEQGALGQSMRWSESFARMLVVSLDRTHDRFERVLDRTMSRLDATEDRNASLVAQREALLDAAAERGVRVYREHVSIQREDRAWRAAETLLVPYLSKLAGFEAKHPLVQSLQTLSSDEVRRMLSVLPPEKAASIIDAIQNLAAASGQAAQLTATTPAPVPVSANGKGG